MMPKTYRAFLAMLCTDPGAPKQYRLLAKAINSALDLTSYDHGMSLLAANGAEPLIFDAFEETWQLYLQTERSSDDLL